MDQKKTDMAVVELLKADLPGAFRKMLVAGEVPYRANRQALTKIDIEEDDIAGKKQVQILLKGLETWKKALQGVRDAANAVQKRASAVRPTQDNA